RTAAPTRKTAGRAAEAAGAAASIAASATAAATSTGGFGRAFMPSRSRVGELGHRLGLRPVLRGEVRHREVVVALIQRGLVGEVLRVRAGLGLGGLAGAV